MEEKIRDAMLKYTQDAYNMKDEVRDMLDKKISQERKRRKIGIRIGVSLAAASLIICFIGFTPYGRAFAQAVEDTIQRIFSAKEIEVNIEGETENIVHDPYSEDPDDEKSLSGYVIYVDTNTYKVQKSNGVEIITPKPMEPMTEAEKEAMYLELVNSGTSEQEARETVNEAEKSIREYIDSPPELPDCLIEISQTANVSPRQCAENESVKLKEIYQNVSDIRTSAKPENSLAGLVIRSDSGNKWNSPIEYTYFIDNEKGGTFMIRCKYFLEASEGHGARFSKILDSFEIVND